MPGPEDPRHPQGAPGPPTPAPQPAPQREFALGELAGWWTRLGARMIDGLVVWIPALLLVGVMIALVSSASGDARAAAIGGLVLAGAASLAAVFLYRPLLMRRQGTRNGQTLGKQLLGIRVVRDNGEPVDMAWGVMREVVMKQLALWIATLSFFGLPWLVNYLWPLWDMENRALHDMACDTHVVLA